jgi:hypothetical protein
MLQAMLKPCSKMPPSPYPYPSPCPYPSPWLVSPFLGQVKSHRFSLLLKSEKANSGGFRVTDLTDEEKPDRARTRK